MDAGGGDVVLDFGRSVVFDFGASTLAINDVIYAAPPATAVYGYVKVTTS